MCERKPEHRITLNELQHIVSQAKSNWVDLGLPLKISGKVCQDNEPAHAAMLDAVISYLTNKGLLNTQVRIDYDSTKR